MKKRKFSSRSRAAKKAQQFKAKPSKGRERERSGQAKGGHRFQGRVQKNPRGFAFILSRDKNTDDAYVPKSEAQALLNDDIVEYTLYREGRRLSARITRVIRRGQTEIVGKVQGKGEDLAVVTNDGQWHQIAGRARAGEWVRARIEHYPDRQRPSVVRVEESLGTTLLPSHDPELAIARFNLPHHFSDAALIEARSRRQDEETQHRKDHREKPFVTIDGEDAKDFDDAILVEEERDGFRLYVAIADVSYYVRPGTQLDREAQNRGTSVYFPNYVIPMLPEVLSNDLCSLRPKERKLTLTAEILYDQRGQVIGRKFYENIIQTHARLTYKDVQEFFKGTAPLPDGLDKPLNSARKLFQLLKEDRKRRGVLDFDLPECRMTLDDKGYPVQIGPAQRWDSHKLIEEFMIAANREVAKVLREQNVPSLHRVHESPNPDSLSDVNELLRSLGISQKLRDLSPKAFSELLDATRQLTGAGTLHKAILRLQKQAHYEAEPRGHFGLALRDYTHFTSPIRRYPDLAVHRALKRVIHKGKYADKDIEEDSLDALGESTSERERRAMEAERFLLRRKQCWYLSKRLGEVFPGVISGVVKSGIFVEMTEIATDGFVPIDALDGFYEFDPRAHCMRKRPGRETLSVGGAIRVQVVKVDLDEQEITLAIA